MKNKINFLLTLVISLFVLNKNSFSAEPRKGRIDTLHEDERRILIQKREPFLKKNIEGLISGDSITLRNIGAILKLGYESLKDFSEKKTILSSEKIGMHRIKEIHQPHKVTLQNISNKQLPETSFTQDWMSYSDKAASDQAEKQGFQETFVDFANAVLGGGWDAGGNVQEEQMVQQCPDLALILSHPWDPHGPIHETLTRRDGPGGASDAENLLGIHGANLDSADPILITHLRCILHLHDAYSRDPYRIRSEVYSDLGKVFDINPNAPAIQVIAMAAPQIYYDDRGKAYSLLLLQDLFNNAYTAFQLTKTYDQMHGKKSSIITGRWGAGAFGHHVSVVVAIQYLAAIYANIEAIRFTGISLDEGQKAIDIVNSLAQKLGPAGSVPQTVLERLLVSPQTKDWKTRPL